MEPVKNKTHFGGQFSDSLYFASGAFFRAVGKLANDCWRPSHLPASEASLLIHLFTNPCFAFPDFISATVRVNPSSISRLTEKLISKGLVTRRPSGNWTCLKPTKEAEKLLPLLLQCKQDFEARCNELLGRGRSYDLAASLHRAADKLEAYCGNPPQNAELGVEKKPAWKRSEPKRK